MSEIPRSAYAATRRVIGDSLTDALLSGSGAESFPERLALHLAENNLLVPDWVIHLAELERTVAEAGEWTRNNKLPATDTLTAAVVNPGLMILNLPVQGMVEVREALLKSGPTLIEPTTGQELLMAWPDAQGDVQVRAATPEDLLALKMAEEQLGPRDVAKETGAPAAALVRLLIQAHWEDLVLLPPSAISRPPKTHPRSKEVVLDDEIFMSRAFVLQWHITQRCDLSCRHCYDRSSKEDVGFEEGMGLLNQMADFCTRRRVMGQVSFSGGNPLLHPHFFDFYERAVDLGLNVAVLGNPCEADVLDRLCAIEPPVYYQVSLEGLEVHDNFIRGLGHFAKVMDFLALLKERDILSQVMLTLTADNMDQVIPLADALEGKVDSFTFNRLAPVGEGAALSCADATSYERFLRSYLEACREHPHMGLKDNLFNVLLREAGEACFGGCTGSGCGAAYNFLSVVCDGSVHACRKMDSPVGHLREASLGSIYDGLEADRYRAGPEGCRECEIRPACGGCMAVIKGMGLDPFTDRDPYCPLNRAS